MVKKLDNQDFEEDEQGGYCFSEEMSYTLESLGNDAWLTGCSLCGSNCWEDKRKKDAFKKIYEDIV